MASQVMTISRIFVLLWFTIFFDTVSPTTPSAFTDAHTSTYATDITTENVTDFTATTIWKTVSPTTPSTFTDADTSPYATDSTTDNMTDFATTISNNTTENVTMVTVLPATTISNNTTENVTMVTVFPATTIPNNTTNNVTMATVFQATTIANNTFNNVTMATVFPATTIANNTTQNVTMATDLPATTTWNNTTENGTMPTDIPPTTISNTGKNTEEWVYILPTIGVIIMLLVAIVVYRKTRAKFSNDGEQAVLDTNYKHRKWIPYHLLGFTKDDRVEDASYTHDKDRISDYELWNLIRYARHFEEEDKLSLAVENLWSASGTGLHSISYGSTEDLYESLRCWKRSCCFQSMNQPNQLYKACTDAGMVKIARRLRDLRLVVCDVEDVTSMELEHILWQIGKRSTDNITQLLKALGIESGEHQNTSLKNIVEKALKKLETWKEGFIPFNPVVILSLRWEDLGFGADEPDFFRVPEEEKQKLPDTEVSKYAYLVTIRHCNKLFQVIKSNGRGKGVLINQKPCENQKVLFDTSKMIEDWLEQQECSNYEKRRRLEAAHRVPNDHDDELFTEKTIKGKASGDESNRVAVAYELLMTDILPFARALGVNESKLQEYGVQSTNRSFLKMGTIGLVTILVDK